MGGGIQFFEGFKSSSITVHPRCRISCFFPCQWVKAYLFQISVFLLTKFANDTEVQKLLLLFLKADLDFKSVLFYPSFCFPGFLIFILSFIGYSLVKIYTFALGIFTSFFCSKMFQLLYGKRGLMKVFPIKNAVAFLKSEGALLYWALFPEKTGTHRTFYLKLAKKVWRSGATLPLPNR